MSNAVILGPIDVPMEPCTAPDGRNWIAAYEFEEIPKDARVFAVEIEDDQYEPELSKGDLVFVVGNGKLEDLGKYTMAMANPAERIPILVRVAVTTDGVEIYSMQKSADQSLQLRKEDFLWILPIHCTRRIFRHADFADE